LRLKCPQCSAIFSIDDSLLLGRGIKAQCPACGVIQVVRPEGENESPVTQDSEQTPPAGIASQKATDVPDLADPLDIELDLPQSKPTQASQDPFDGIQIGNDPSTAALESGKEKKPPPLPELPPMLPQKADTDQAGSSGLEVDTMQGNLQTGNEPVQESSRCERCGAVMAPNSGSLCANCEGQVQGAGLVQNEREWRVKKPDGIVLGPLTLEEVREKFTAGEVAAEDRVARGEQDFKLISSFPEFAMFFRRPGETVELKFKHSPRQSGKRSVVILFVIVLAILGGGAWYYFTYMYAGSGKVEDDIRDEILERFGREIPQPQGTVDEAIAKGRRLFLADDRLSYMQADKAFKTAMLIEPNSIEACAGWVQNQALLDTHQPDVALRKMALDLIDYTLERDPSNPLLFRSKAYLYYSIGRVDDARKLANKALEKMEEDPESMLILGAAFLDSNTEMAIEMFNKALAKNSKLNLAYRLLGEANIRLGKFRDALKFFDKRLEQDPGQFDVLQASARVYLAIGQFSKARETYEMMLATEPNRATALVALARLYTQISGQPRKTVSLLEKSLTDAQKIPPVDRAQIYTELSIAYRVLGNKTKARETVDKALADDSIHIPALFAQAVLSQQEGDVALALGQLKGLLTHLPQSARLRARLAETLSLVPEFSKAQQELKGAIDMAPNDLELHLMMAVFHVFVDNPNQAYAWLKRSTGIDPFYAREHQSSKAYYADPSFLKLSAKRAVALAEKFEDDPLILSLTGAVLLRAGKIDKAKNKLLQALELDPECFSANLFLGLLHVTHNRAATAVPFLKQAHEADRLHHVAARLYGYALMKTGKIKRAKELFNNVLKAAPGDLSVRLRLAELYLKTKKRKKATKELLVVYSGDSDNLWAKKLLFQLGH
jgi:predicted Zn finger-like uncharacterized protein